MEDPKWMTRKEAAAYLRVSERTVDRLRESGRLRTYGVGRGVRLLRSQVEKLLQESTDEDPESLAPAA